MSSIGVQVSVEKCQLWSLNQDLDTSLLPPEITVQRLGLKNLGAPVSDNQELDQRMFSKRVEKCKERMESVRLPENPPVGASPSSQLRSISEDHLQPSELRRIFNLLSPHPSQISTPLFSALEAITGSAVSDCQRLPSPLPVSNGGIGLPIASKLCHAAFLSSYVDTKPLADQIINNSPQLAPGSVQNCVSALQCHEPTIQSVPVLSPLALKPSSVIINGSSWLE